jgi:hypothetical protein
LYDSSREPFGKDVGTSSETAFIAHGASVDAPLQPTVPTVDLAKENAFLRRAVEILITNKRKSDRQLQVIRGQ